MSFEGVKYRTADNWFGVLPVTTVPIRYLEIGAFYGANLISVNSTYAANPASQMVCIDPWIDDENIYNTFCRNMESNGVDKKLTVMRGFSHEMIPKLEDNTFDIIYIDGNHEPDAVLEDAVLAFRKLKVGGTMIFDDYGWGGPDLTQRGIDAFISAYHRRISPMISNINTQVFVKKIRDPIHIGL
jgi:predicted O-methyltransferase YrrM